MWYNNIIFPKKTYRLRLIDFRWVNRLFLISGVTWRQTTHNIGINSLVSMKMIKNVEHNMNILIYKYILIWYGYGNLKSMKYYVKYPIFRDIAPKLSWFCIGKKQSNSFFIQKRRYFYSRESCPLIFVI